LDKVHHGNLIVDGATSTVRVEGRAVKLTPHEFELLLAFCRQPNRIIAFDALCRGLWDAVGVKERRRLNVLVFRLRSKLADCSPYRLEMVRGRGYGLIEPRNGVG